MYNDADVCTRRKHPLNIPSAMHERVLLNHNVPDLVIMTSAGAPLGRSDSTLDAAMSPAPVPHHWYRLWYPFVC